MARRIVTLLALVGLLGSACKKQTVQPAEPPIESAPADGSTTAETSAAPSRIVLFIGDGLGVGQLTAASYMRGAPLEMLSLPHLGFMTTHSHEFLTTDSAASATAIATGRKTHFNGISVTPGTTKKQESDPEHRMQTLLELAEEQGLRTGMVAPVRIVHATPAAFAAHRHERHEYEPIASDIAASGIDVLIGAGSKYFEEREDGRDLLAEMAADGYHVAKSRDELQAMPPEATQLAALMHDKDMPFVTENGRAMELADMVSTAIDVLDRENDDGWVLLVEGSLIDWCGHQLEGACAGMEANDLDAAVGRAIDYADDRDDTLIVATADHETGGLAVLDPYYSNRFAKILGGYDAAAKDAALPALDGEPRPSPPPFEFVGIGENSPKLATKPLPTPGVWEMTEYEDGRAALVHGYFSVASRALWERDDRFYGAHTPTMVSIHASGPGAEQVVDARDNADLGQSLRELVAAHSEQKRLTDPAPDDETRPTNVILMVGDGMGMSSVTGGYYYHGGLTMTELPHRGLVATHAVDYLVNDSAATATAMATGRRTKKKAVGNVWTGEGLAPGESVIERAEARGMATGILTTTPVTHATPAAFYAHRDTRYETDGILEDLATMPSRIEGSDGIDLLVGGGQEKVSDAAKQKLVDAGYTVADSWPVPEGGPVVGILAPDGLPEADARSGDGDPATPTLAEMTRFALERLSTDEEGFFLLVEGGQIDWRLHEMTQDAGLLDEVVDFDDAVAVAREFAADRGDTLVIVTADHDHTMSILDNHYAFESGRCSIADSCGGPWKMPPIPIRAEGLRHSEGFSDAALQGNFADPRFFVQYAWPIQEAAQRVDVGASHSANFVPLFAFGPWSHRLEGFVDQPEIGRLLHAWASE